MRPPLRNPRSPRLGTFRSRLRETRKRLREIGRLECEEKNGRPRSVRGGPKVSVMLVTYNHERYVGQALKSILSQKRNFKIEINVIDDASTDRTQEIVRAYQRKHPRLINCYFNKVNVGHMATQLNTFRGFKTLRGEYFALLEGDDYWTDKDKLAKQVAFLDENASYVACAHQTKKFYDDGSKPPEHFLPFKAFGRNRASIESLIRMDGVFHLSSILYRNIFGLRPPPALHDPYSCEVTINMIYGVFGDFFCLDEYMSAYRVHGGGSFSTKNQEKIWLFHLGGFRRFSLYLGPRYWGVFAGTVLSFSRYVLSAPKRGELSKLSPKAQAIVWLHLIIAAPLFVVFAPVDFLSRVAKKIPRGKLDRFGPKKMVARIYAGLVGIMPDVLIHRLLAIESRFRTLKVIRRRLKTYVGLSSAPIPR